MRAPFPAATALAALLLAAALPAWAEYVAYDAQAPLRAGPSADTRIVALLKVGAPVTVLAASGEWTQVRAEDGPEGWMEATAVAAEPPGDASESVEAAHIERAALKRELERWTADHADVVALRIAHDALKARAAEDAATIERLEMTNRKASARSNVYWALSGAVVVVIGYILGYLYASNRGRSRSGYRF